LLNDNEINKILEENKIKIFRFSETWLNKDLDNVKKELKDIIK